MEGSNQAATIEFFPPSTRQVTCCCLNKSLTQCIVGRCKGLVINYGGEGDQDTCLSVKEQSLITG